MQKVRRVCADFCTKSVCKYTHRVVCAKCGVKSKVVLVVQETVEVVLREFERMFGREFAKREDIGKGLVKEILLKRGKRRVVQHAKVAHKVWYRYCDTSMVEQTW